MEDKKIKDICSRYPWTEEAEAELSAMTEKARPMFNPDKQAALNAKLEKDGFPSEEELNRQHEKMMAEAAQSDALLHKAFSDNPIKVLEDQINFYIDFVNAFMDPKATDEQKLKVWPDYKDYSSEFIREQALKRRRYLEKELPALLEKFSTAYEGRKTEELSDIIATAITTRYPEVFITPKDKVSNYLFDGKISEELAELKLRTESAKSRKELTAVVSIDYDELNGIEIRGRREFNAYDREVHDSIVSLYIDGGNEYITPQMIYRTMTGNPGAKLSDKQAEAISASVTKCMFSKLTIDASREAEAYKMDKLKYEGNLIYAEKVMGMSKGEVLEWIHIIKEPILYQYASSKNQIGRLDIKLLNTPINKTEEVITLQGYLYRRILAMNGTLLSRNIVYDAIYKAIDVTAKTEGALRKKKNKVRDQVREMLDYWIGEGFISGYTENKKGTSIYSVTIHTNSSR